MAFEQTDTKSATVRTAQGELASRAETLAQQDLSSVELTSTALQAIFDADGKSRVLDAVDDPGVTFLAKKTLTF